MLTQRICELCYRPLNGLLRCILQKVEGYRTTPLGQLDGANSLLPVYHANSPLPTHCKRTPHDQLTTVTLQATASQRKSWAGGQVSGWAECREQSPAGRWQGGGSSQGVPIFTPLLPPRQAWSHHHHHLTGLRTTAIPAMPGSDGGV